ncbi:T-cell surface glycoprotein CD3 epsilon chain-like [Notolabrus celidotus]|uniref:T-cell surface glycoprotein CD3 epsilon chain-like n=1 Tax=Notolabrus celidotus TaxID=1203425 RepID=UPI00148FE74D|nr:T-cell surface glycoprotein CD3 epsilon chain-like [Notolabrus celidotus]
MGVRAVLTVLVLFIVSVDAGNERVTFWRKNITMTCPDSGTWHNEKGEELSKNPTKEYKFEYDNGKKGTFYCQYGISKRYSFYVQGKACENCFELDAKLFGLAIIVDIVGTVAVMFIIYRCTGERSSEESSNASNAPARPGGRAPPVPSPDYEHLNPQTRNQDPYSRLN